MNIIIALCTFRRQEYLKQCLNSLAHINIPNGYNLSVVVIDNENSQNTQHIVESFDAPFLIDYISEPQTGLVFARNRALIYLREKMPDYVGFIDDDETVSQNWLPDMIRDIKQYNADVISGYVKIMADKNIHDALIKAYQFKQSKGYKFTFTVPMGNIFFKKSLLESHLVFDKKFNHTGGEDIDFFKRACNMGFKLLRSPNAVVYETLVPEKASFRAYFNRQCRVFQTHYSDKNMIKSVLPVIPEIILTGFMVIPAILSANMRIKCLKNMARIYGRIMSRIRPKSFYGI